MVFNVQWPVVVGHEDPRWCWGCLGVPSLQDTVDGRCPHCGMVYAEGPGHDALLRLEERVEAQEATVSEASELTSDPRATVSTWAAERLPQAKKVLAVLRAALDYLRSART